MRHAWLSDAHRRTRRQISLLLVLLVALPILSGAESPYGWSGGLPLGASTSAPEQRSGTADGSAHEASAESTRINRDLPKRDQPRPKGAVADQPAPLPEVKAPAAEDQKVTPKVEKPVLPALDKNAVERPQDRTETTQTFDNPDGSRTLRLHTGPANVRQPDGSWLPVDLTLAPAGDRLKPKTTPTGLSFATSSADSALVQIDVDGDHSISYGMRDVTSVPGEVKGEQVTYRGVRPGTDLRLTATRGGVKEDLLLASAAAQSSYSFTLKLKRLTPRVDSLGGIELVDGDKIVATIPAGVMDDAAGVRSTGVKYGLDKIADDTWVLRVDADQTWLRDPARKFPVTLDPSTDRFNTDSDAMFVRSNGFGGANGGLEVGRVEGNPVSRTYLHFGGAQNALRNRYVVSASLAADNVYSTNCTPRSVSVFEVTQPWSSSMRWPGAAVGQSLSSQTFAHGGAAGTACASPNWTYFTLDPDLMTRWTHGSALGHGLSLRMSDESLREGRRFASASTVNKPYLEVRFSPEGASYEATGATLPSNVKEGKLSVKVTNLGMANWPTSGGVHFGYIIKQGDREVARRNGFRVPSDLAPMATHEFVDLPLPALAPADYDVFLTMFNPDGTDFRDAHGVPYGRMPITVSNRAPTTDYQQPGTGATVESLRPTLFVKGVDPDNWPARGLTYKFRVCTDAALTLECQETPEWGGQSFSPQLTRWNKTYYWGIKAYDTVDERPTWAGPYVLTTRVPQPAITSHLAGSPNSTQGPGLDPNIGNFSAVVTDASIPTVGPDLTISRTYNSLDPRKDTAFGTGWSSRLDMRMKFDDDHSENVVITHPTGRQVRYGRNPDNTYGSPSGSTADFVYTPSTGIYTLRDTTGAQWRFDSLGRLATIVDPAGLTETLAYDDNDRVKTITNDTSKRTLTVSWERNHVSSVTTQEPEPGTPAPVWTYTYVGDQLKTVCVPGAAPNCTTQEYTDGSHYRSTVLDDRPKTYWRLGETSGNTFTNVTARSDGQYAAQSRNVVLGTAGALEGTSDRAATFDGNSSYVTLPDALTSESMSLAVELWFKTTSQGTLLSYADKDFPATAGKSAPVLYVGTDGLLYGGFSRRDAGGPRQVVSPQTVNDDQWHHVVLSAAVDTQTLYLDGRKVGESLAGLIDHKEQTKLTLGAGSGKDWPATNGGDFYFAGSIDEAAIYLHPLGSLAVAEHHTAKSKLDLLTSIKLPQDNRQHAKLTYDDVNDRVATLLDHTGRSWSLDTPRIVGATRTAVLRGPSNFGDWSYEFDLDNGGRLTSVTHDGATSRNEYNTAGFLSATVDESGLRTELTTDARGNVLSRKMCRAAGSCNTSYFTYLPADPLNLLDPRNDKVESTSDARSTDAADTRFRVNYTYDAAGRPTGVSSPAPAGVTVRPSTSITYATGGEAAVGGGTVPAGLPIKSTGKRGQVTSFSYFANGDQAEVSSPSGLKIRSSYDALGRQKSVTSGNAGGGVFGTTTYEYTPRSKVAKVTAPAVQNTITGKTHQQVTTFRYDGNDNMLETTVSDVLPVADGGTPSRTTKTAYDAQDRLVRTEFPDGGTETRAYSDNGLTETVTDVNKVVWTSQFEERGLLLSRTATTPGADPEDPGAGGLLVESHVYDPAGKVRSSDDAMGRKTTFSYYDDGLLATSTRNGYHDPNGTVRDVLLEDRTYDPVGNLALLVSAGGRKTTQTFDAAGLPVTSTFDPDGLRRSVTYTRDADGNAVKTERRGAADDTRVEVTAYELDLSNQVTAEHAYVNANTAFTTRYDRDERGLLKSVTDRRLNTTTFAYDAKGNQVSVTSPAVETWVGGVRTAGFAGSDTAGRNAFGEQTHTRDAAGAVSVTEYDSMGRATKVSLPAYTPPGGQPVVHSKRMEYDQGGRLKKSIDGLNRVTSYDHDPYGRVTATTLPQVGDVPAVVRARYNRAGDLLAGIDPMGIETRFTYDELGRQITTTEVDRSSGTPLYFTTTTKHDLAGNALAMTNSMNATSSVTYNAAGEALTSTDPTDRVARTTYDNAGRVATSTDPSGLVSSQTYDLLGRAVRSANLVNGTELRAGTTEYDPAGNVLKRTSPQGRVSSYTYDALGRLFSQTEKVDTTKSVVTSFGYDKLGNRSRFVDGRGNATVYTYTAGGLPESTIEPATTATPNAADRTWTTVYDAAGQITRELKPGGVAVDREYDAQGRVKVERGTGGESATTDRTFGYDLAGRMIKIGGPAGDSGYTYDDRGNLLTSYGAGGSATYTYNGDGTVATRKDVTGDASFTYDKAGRLLSSADPLSGRTVDYGYDSAGRLGVVSDRAVSSWTSRRLTYDPLGRQTSDQVQETVEGGLRVLVGAEYGYDLDGKVTSKKVTDTSGSAANTYGYDGAGRLTSWTGPVGTTAYRWDDSGNRVGAGAATFEYDERNRLKSGGGATYTYTPRGTRASVTQNGQTTTSNFDAFDRLASSGAVSYRYDSLDRVTDRNGVAFRYQGQTNDAVSDGSRLISRLPDGTAFSDKVAGSTVKGRMLFADQHGDVIGRYLGAAVDGLRAFDPFGAVTSSSGVGSSLGFQGDWTDGATGSVNMGARWYAPGAGQFVSRDDWTLDPSPSSRGNRYAYTWNDPVNGADPDGHDNIPVLCLQDWDFTPSSITDLRRLNPAWQAWESFFKQMTGTSECLAQTAGTCVATVYDDYGNLCPGYMMCPDGFPEKYGNCGGLYDDDALRPGDCKTFVGGCNRPQPNSNQPGNPGKRPTVVAPRPPPPPKWWRDAHRYLPRPDMGVNLVPRSPDVVTLPPSDQIKDDPEQDTTDSTKTTEDDKSNNAPQTQPTDKHNPYPPGSPPLPPLEIAIDANILMAWSKDENNNAQEIERVIGSQTIVISPQAEYEFVYRGKSREFNFEAAAWLQGLGKRHKVRPGVRPSDHQIEAIRNRPVPKNMAKVQESDSKVLASAHAEGLLLYTADRQFCASMVAQGDPTLFLQHLTNKTYPMSCPRPPK